MNKEYNFYDFFEMIFNEKKLILFVALALMIFFAVTSLFLPKLYTASIKVVATEESNSLSSSFSQIAGLAQLGGVNLSGITGGESKNSTIGLELIYSEGFILAFLEKYNHKKNIMALRGFNSNDDPVYSKNLLNEKGELVDRFMKWELVREFKRLVRVDQDPLEPVITISIKSKSPKISYLILNDLLAEINQHIQDKDARRSSASIDYLNNLINSNQNVALQSVFFRILERETQKLMLTNSSDEYVFTSIDGPNIPERRSSPRRTLIALSGFLMGILLSIAYILIRNLITK
jgi:uncharacterized protein involved in exopolysaccharide biosynthesis